MRKILLGVLIGLFLALPLSVAAAEVASLVGKKVEGTLPIKVGTERAATDAIVINNVSYAPIRAVAELVGAEVDFVDGEIILTPKESAAVMEEVATGGSSITPEEAAAIAEENERLLEEARRKGEELQREIDEQLRAAEEFRKLQEQLKSEPESE